jgi:triacylglycerol lipase
VVQMTMPRANERDRGGASAEAQENGTWPRPPLWYEQRAALELGELFTSPVYLGIGVPRGDRTPVMAIPGFLGSDDYLSILHGWLRRVGYRPAPFGLHCIGPIDAIAARLERRAERVAEETGRRLVLIGHSLGGMLSCRLARRRPDLVEQVITLGSARTTTARDSSDPLIGALADMLLGQNGTPPTWSEDGEMLGSPLPDDVRLACIYSRDDAVVHWRACLDADPRTIMHEVRGTHTGLAWNARVYRHLGRLLASG